MQSKKLLEELLGQKVTSFCYPGGEYKPQHVAMVREAGYDYARSVRRYSFDSARPNSYEADTTIHAYGHYLDIFRIAKFARFLPWRFVRFWQWDKLAIAMVDHAARTGGTFHLWGHSWEIEQRGEWDKLERVLSYISKLPNVRHIANRELDLTS